MNQLEIQQRTLAQYADSPEESTGSDDADAFPPFEEYGPTSTRPLPLELQLPAWRLAMRDRGFSPGCLLEWLSHGLMDEYHIDDTERPGVDDLWREELQNAKPQR